MSGSSRGFRSSLDFINQEMEKLDKEEEYHIHCKGGYRSVIFASILKSRGFEKLIDIKGGITAIEEVGVPLTDYVCPNTGK